MRLPGLLRRGRAPASAPAELLSRKYRWCREVTVQNSESLALLAGVQEDLLYAPPRTDVIGERVARIFDHVTAVVEALEWMTDRPQARLRAAMTEQRREVEQFLAARQERTPGRLAVRLSDVGARDAAEVGGKAAALAEVRNRLGIPVPDGFVMTTEAYEQFWVVPGWRAVRDATRELDPADLASLRRASRQLRAAVLDAALPRALEVGLVERAALLDAGGLGVSVRSSAVGEGLARSFAGQFRSSINVSREEVPAAYKAVVASRFSERALAYRASLGRPDVESPMAVLVLPTLAARAAGILYSRDPQGRRGDELWVTGRWGLGLDVALGRRADLFVVSRRHGHACLEQRVVRKDEEILPRPGGGLVRRKVGAERREAPCLRPGQLRELAEWALAIERHFGAPQDLEWVLDDQERLWIVQARPLALARAGSRARTAGRAAVLLAGGRTVYPGRVAGPAFVADGPEQVGRVPNGAILFLRRATPDIVRVLSRTAGIVAEWGNITGHAATLLREFQVPSLFEVPGAFDRVTTGMPVSLDSSAGRVYEGLAWRTLSRREAPGAGAESRARDVVSRRLLALNLVDASAWGFRPSRCESAHDVLRYCHEKAIEGMFALNDRAVAHGAHGDKRLATDAPINLHLVDLGGGLHEDAADASSVGPSQVTSRPFQALWRGLTHPAVTWNRNMPASLGSLASVMGQAFSATQPSTRRAVGAKSYLMVTREYMNLNARLAFHFTLVDATVADDPAANAIGFRFAGGGATRLRRDLRACFLEACLVHYGFAVDRRGDLVNAWFRKASADGTEAALEIVGRLMACSSQLDMYMTGTEVMRWYVDQFLAGNYGFRPVGEVPTADIPWRS